jgi:hypothetical protein
MSQNKNSTNLKSLSLKIKKTGTNTKLNTLELQSADQLISKDSIPWQKAPHPKETQKHQTPSTCHCH